MTKYTLPLTCRQILIIAVSLLVIIGLYLVYNGQFESGSVRVGFVTGVIILGVLGGLGLALVMFVIGDWLCNHVRCKCDKK